MSQWRTTLLALACVMLCASAPGCHSDPPQATITLSVEPNPVPMGTFNSGHGNVMWWAHYTVTVRESAGVAATVTSLRALALDPGGQVLSQTDATELPAPLTPFGSLQISVNHFFSHGGPDAGPAPPSPLRYEVTAGVKDENGFSSAVRIVAGDARTGP